MKRTTPTSRVIAAPPYCRNCNVPIRLPDGIEPGQVALMLCRKCTERLSA